ncbi:MAG: B12-binding domain-containing radical SAM protein [Deltaproteobacteria bacterium]|nr:B12-binding domain-containing radical SAM protein [Deltaproteobacteria bacterium]
MLITQPKIVLVNPPSNCVEDDHLEPPLGLLYIISTLRENKYDDISLYDMTGCQTEWEILNKIRTIPCADIYGITCFSTNYQYAKKIINHIKKNIPKCHIIIGGPHPSGISDLTVKNSNADTVVVGEGEDVFSDIVTAFTRRTLPKGIIYGRGREDIDSYAFPARDIVDISTYSRKLMGQPVVSLLSSRGCTHSCIHCNSVVMGGRSNNVRYRTPDNIISEIKSLRDNFAFYRFNDDYFTGNLKLEELLIKLKEFHLRFRIFAKIEDLDDKTCKLLKEAGCVHISVGLESLNYENLKILGKKSQIGKEDNVKIAKDHGLTIRASFMVGLPYDNEKNIYVSFKKAAKLGIDEFAIYPLIPYPGTIIWKHPENFGYTTVHSDFTDYVQMGKNGKTCYALQHKNFTPKDVERWLHVATSLMEQGVAKHMMESLVA